MDIALFGSIRKPKKINKKAGKYYYERLADGNIYAMTGKQLQDVHDIHKKFPHIFFKIKKGKLIKNKPVLLTKEEEKQSRDFFKKMLAKYGTREKVKKAPEVKEMVGDGALSDKILQRIRDRRKKYHVLLVDDKSMYTFTVTPQQKKLFRKQGKDVEKVIQ